MEQFEKTNLARDILAYLTEHPKAQDTLEGIVEWWLLDQVIQRWSNRVKEALGDLVVQGLVVERKTRDGRIHYRINKQKRHEIRELLKLTSEP